MGSGTGGIGSEGGGDDGGQVPASRAQGPEDAGSRESGSAEGSDIDAIPADDAVDDAAHAPGDATPGDSDSGPVPTDAAGEPAVGNATETDTTANATANADATANATADADADAETDTGTGAETGAEAGQDSDTGGALHTGAVAEAAAAGSAPTPAVRKGGGGSHTGTPGKVPRPRKRRTWLRWVAGGVGVVVLATAGAGWWFYQKLDANITIDTNAAAQLQTYEKERPTPVALDALNILLIGSDSRSGKGNAKYGHDEGGTARSDTTILLHLAADRKSATAVSIPRDLMVHIPSCGKPGGSTTKAQFAQFNWAFEFGGTACTTRTVEQLTGVRIDHEMVIDFSGFKDMVNAVGGVQVCLAEPVDDQDAHLKLPAGKQTVNGEQALGFVRARHGFGDGSDTGRITRQQGFLGALFTKVQSNGVLLNPTRLYPVLDAATKAITTDPGLDSLRDLYNLAHSMRDVPSDKVQFLTVPQQPYGPDPNRDELVQPEADQLFGQLRDDAPVTVRASGSPTAPGGSPSATSSASPSGATAGKTAGSTSGSTAGSATGSASGSPTGSAGSATANGGKDSGKSSDTPNRSPSGTVSTSGAPTASGGTATTTPGPTYTGTNASVGLCE